MTHELVLDIPDAWWMTSNMRLHWTQESQRTSNLRVRACLAARQQRLPKGLPRVEVTAYVTTPTRRIFDPGNAYPVFKALIDGLVDYGLVADDDRTRLVGPNPRDGGVTPGRRTVRLEIQEIPMTAQPSAPPALSPRQQAQLIRSLVSHAVDDQQMLDEIRAVLAGADIDDLLTLRGGAT